MLLPHIFNIVVVFLNCVSLCVIFLLFLHSFVRSRVFVLFIFC